MTFASRFAPLVVPAFAASLATVSLLTPALAPSPAQARESASGCEAPAPKKGGLLGSRIAKLTGSAAVAVLSGRKAAATGAAEAALRDGVDGLAKGAAAPTACHEKPVRPAETKREASPAPPAYSRPSQMPVPADIKAQIAAFDEFGRVDCMACEGGRSYDSWAQQAFAGELRGEYNGWAKKLGGLEEGQSLAWQGAEANGRISVTGAAPVGGFACKQFTWELFRGGASATRPGLVCRGRLNEYAASESWVEVY